MTALTISPRSTRRAFGARGFTIVEVMFTLVILGILTAFALPEMSKFVKDQRVKAATQDVFATLLYARSEAIKRAADINVNPTTTDWAGGWSVKASGTSLKVQESIGGVAISGPASGVLVFRRDGRLSATVPVFVVSSATSSQVTARCVRIDPSGRASILTDTNGIPSDGCN
jgi:type IV fimbrial biogenesis protein FimT